MTESKTKNAIELLKEDHRTVEKLFKEFQDAKGNGAKGKLAHRICFDLIIHAELEETIFYPACEGIVEESDLKEGYVEHDAAKLLVAEILANEGADDEFFDTKVHVLEEEIEHHIKEEEEPGGIFAQARKGDLDLASLGDRLAGMKKELTDRYEAEGLPQPRLKTMDEVSV